MKKKNLTFVIFVASLLLAVTLMDTWILYRQTHNQTKQAGSLQLASVSEKMESAFSDAQILTAELAIKAREYLDDKEALEKFLCDEKACIVSDDTGVFNIYVAGSDFTIIPDFDMPDDYNATERVWYTGAIKNQGRPYISPPYQDAMSGEICYSVSIMMGDSDAVLSMDYTMEGVRSYIAQMSDNAVNAVIVTDEGIVAGCSKEDKVGKKIAVAMPDYAGIYASVKNKDEVITSRIKDGFFYENLFATRSGNGWYLIVGMSDWELYKSSYIQLSVTILLSLALFAIIITLYLFAQKSREKAEKALISRDEFMDGITGELNDPLNRILEHSSIESIGQSEDYEEELAQVHAAGLRLSEMMQQIMSYKSIISAEKKKESAQENKKRGLGVNKRFRAIILLVMVLCLCISVYTSVSSAYQWGSARMQNEAVEYEYQLSEWINTQKSILDMFVSGISTNPKMLDDYEGTVAYLNNITMQYPEISVTYMTNPDFAHTVYMSNGWEPDEGWHVEERQWYIDTLASETGWSVSAPYYDEQTGGYCLTLSKMVYDAKTGEFLGIFGIDFFMDKLVEILGDSYTENGYAFLVDPEGKIINHPYGAYQMNSDGAMNVQALSYGEIRADGKTISFIKDYDGENKILVAARNEDSNFSVYVVMKAWNIYGNAVLYALFCFVAFMACIILVYRLVTRFISWQEDTNQKLQEAADVAISAGKAKSSFLAQMSHEIRTPINAVLGMNEMILRESDNDEITECAENIKSAGRTLLSLINSILDFSKIEDGKMRLVPVKYDTTSLINDLFNSIAQRAKDKGLEFEINVNGNLPCALFGDDVRIRQIIMNLLTNAVKYTQKGKVTFSINGKKTSEKEMLLCVSVKDTGIGIREEDREKLFESFARLDETINRNIEGTGLGMAIVTKLLEMMGSSLKLESEYGKGSDFSFELMQEIIDDTPIGEFSERLKRNEDAHTERKILYCPEARILVVDDNEMNRKVARNLMKRNGIVPDEASSGVSAIKKMTEGSYDIVLLDHMMPQMDGVETLKKLREANLVPDGCVVIALTANAVSGAREWYLEQGFDDYLSKPIEVELLEKLLSYYLPKEKVSWKDAKDTKEKTVIKDHNDETEEKIDVITVDNNDGIFEFAPYEDDEDNSETDNEKEYITQKLEMNGIDVLTALEFCDNEFDFYKELLLDYSNSADSKRGELDKAFESANWHDFEVKIHALKSTSKTIGAMDISKKALALEQAAKDGNYGYIKDEYLGTAKNYIKTADTIREIIRSTTNLEG